MNKKMNEGEKFARKCDATNEGMNEGFCFEETEDNAYFKYKKHALAYAKSLGYKNLAESYNDEAHYFTAWDESDFEYVVKNGILIELT